MTVGPLSTVELTKLHKYKSKNMLKTYLSCIHDYTAKLMKDVEPADIPVITRSYNEQLSPAGANKLNDLGR
ncbi:hypothetical protein DPMN_109608 [Dreissena polymorpha]|uniref:Uncharacterized protein n=1 Tax=Dreissena polymorpha TaxID=45954 RepID=A0A9D4KB00_DREPO|nr:hypothetical protein DPMN_109608 [Dreissena polymorpha]